MNAKEKITQHLDMLFATAPRSRAAWELQEELLANSLARYEDQIKDGALPEAALQNVLANIGNVDELIAALPKDDYTAENLEYAEQRQRSAMTVAIAVGLYVLAGVVFFAGLFVGAVLWDAAVLLGLVLAALICVIPTCMLVYNAQRYPKYQKRDDTVVENFKQWNNDASKLSSIRKALSSLIWTLTVIIYLLVSFSTGAWHISWIIFLVAACVESAIGLLFRIRELR